MEGTCWSVDPNVLICSGMADGTCAARAIGSACFRAPLVGGSASEAKLFGRKLD